MGNGKEDKTQTIKNETEMKSEQRSRVHEHTNAIMDTTMALLKFDSIYTFEAFASPSWLFVVTISMEAKKNSKRKKRQKKQQLMSTAMSFYIHIFPYFPNRTPIMLGLAVLNNLQFGWQYKRHHRFFRPFFVDYNL